MLIVIHNAFGDLCKPVASVNTENMERAFKLTNNICSSWWQAEGDEVTVFPCAANGCRSTSVKDIIYNDITDSFFLVDKVGFKMINDDDTIGVSVDANNGKSRMHQEFSGLEIKSIIKHELTNVFSCSVDQLKFRPAPASIVRSVVAGVAGWACVICRNGRSKVE